MKNFHILFIYSIFTVLLNVTGCSSGGGDGTPATQPVITQPLTYSGNSDPAVITLANTPTLVVNVLYGGSTASGIPTGVSTSVDQAQPGNVAVIAESLSSLFHYSMDNYFGNAISGYNVPLAFTINETVYCDSGYFTLNGTLDDYTGTGTIAVSYVNCVLDGITYNGDGSMYVNYIDYYSFNATMDFPLLTMSSPDFSGSMSGSMTIDDSIYGNQFIETMTMNFVAKDDGSNKMYKFENYVMALTINDIYAYDSSASIRYSGTVYDSIHGSVTVDTIFPLSFSSYMNTDPDSGGPLIFTGNNSSIQLTVESGRHVLMELDRDGDLIYEIERYVLWKEIDDHTKLDLADSDDDAMHNSWESMFGLNPNIDDAGDNLDGDGLTNWEEYQQGYDPGDPFSPTP